jgi:hypothetical protein
VLKDPCLGTLDIELDASVLQTRIQRVNSSPVAVHSDFRLANLQLVAVEGTFKGKLSATLSVQVYNATTAHVKNTIEAAKNDVAAGELGNAQVRAGKFAAGLNNVMAKLDIIIKVGDAVSEVCTIIPMYKPPSNVPPRSIRTPRPRGCY